MTTRNRLYCGLVGICLLLPLLAENSLAAPTFTIVSSSQNAAQDPTTPGNRFQNASLNAVLDNYEQLSGKKLIRDSNLVGCPPISIDCTGLSKEDSLKLISATLLLNGVALIPVDDHTMKAVTVGTNKNPRTEGLVLYTKAEDLPADDQIVSYYMQLSHIDPNEAAGIFAQAIPPHTYGVYVPAPSARGIVLTENVSNIRKLIDLQKAIDVPGKGPVANSSCTTTKSQPPPPDGGGMLVFLVLNLFAVAAGTFFACLWVRKRALRN